MSEKLKPCPFCGSSPEKPHRPSPGGSSEMQVEYRKYGNLYSVDCNVCHACVPSYSGVGYHSEKEAADAWNRRSDIHSRKNSLLSGEESGGFIDMMDAIGVKISSNKPDRYTALLSSVRKLVGVMDSDEGMLPTTTERALKELLAQHPEAKEPS